MPEIKTNTGVDLHYRASGSGPVTLVCLHGWGGSSDSWAGLVPHLDGTRYRILCPDLRGHGQSGCPPAGYAWESFAGDVLAMADHEQAAHFIPIGFSMGGKLAGYLAATQARRISAQILVAPVGPGTVPIPRELGLQVCLLAGNVRHSKPFFRSWFAADTAESVVDNGCATMAGTPRRVLEATAEMTLWTSLADVMGTLAQPTLLVTGDRDPVYHLDYQTSATLPFLQEVRMARLAAGHFIPLEKPAELAALISRFLMTV